MFTADVNIPVPSDAHDILTQGEGATMTDEPEQTDNSPRPEDGEQDVSQDGEG